MKFRIRISILDCVYLTVFAASVLILFSFGHVDYRTEPYPLKYPSYFGGRFTIPEDNPTTREGVLLGRHLFYETKLSAGNKLSCSSCHRQELAFTDGKKFSEGVDGSLTRRNSMSLSNLLWVKNFFWDGRVSGLEPQAMVPLTDPHEMGQSLAISVVKLKESKQYPLLFQRAFGSTEITEDRILKAVAQFERTLISADSRYDQYLRKEYQPTSIELEGMKLFTSGSSPEQTVRGGNCIHCHALPKTFSETFHNNGLDNLAVDAGRKDFTHQESDHGRFRVPTLRNIAQTSPYMHDGRFNSLLEVIDHYSDHIQKSETVSPFLGSMSDAPGETQLSFTPHEKEALLSFLEMLTDSTFLNNSEFSNPH